MFQAFPVIIRAAIAAGVVKTLSNIYKNRDIDQLVATSWALSPAKPSNPKNALPHITFKEGGEVSGFAGCNQFFGQYSQKGDRITIGALALTRKACENMDAETRFIEALQASRRVKGTHSQIRLLNDNDEAVLVFTRKKSPSE